MHNVWLLLIHSVDELSFSLQKYVVISLCQSEKYFEMDFLEVWKYFWLMKNIFMQAFLKLQENCVITVYPTLCN